MPRASKKYNLQVINPTLSKQWHPAKNYKLTPKDVTPNSGKKVWWQCEKGHEWQAQVSNKVNAGGCPYCSGKKHSKEYNLKALHPHLALEWNESRNGTLAPDGVTPGSGKKDWWICHKGHEWRAAIYSRTTGNNCPFCSGKKVCEDNCLQTVNPKLASEWHPIKNEKLLPSEVTPSSNKKVWWLCNKGHEWEATINNRTYGRGCPYCSGRRKKPLKI